MPIDLTRSVLVILIPGAVAVAPWLLAMVLYTEATLGYAEKYTTLANAVCFAAAVVVGLICESLGTWIEVRWDRQRTKAKEFEVEKDWFDYLARGHNGEPVGYRYLSRLATAFYFELAMLVAVIPFGLGVSFLLVRRYPEHGVAILAGVTVVALVIIALFRFDARATHGVLCKTRWELNKRAVPHDIEALRAPAQSVAAPH